MLEYVIGCVQLLIVLLLCPFIWTNCCGKNKKSRELMAGMQRGHFPRPVSAGGGRTNLNTNPMFLTGGGGAIPPRPDGPPIAGTHDPNYQTLAAIGPDVFEKKNFGGGGFSPAPNFGGGGGFVPSPNFGGGPTQNFGGGGTALAPTFDGRGGAAPTHTFGGRGGPAPVHTFGGRGGPAPVHTFGGRGGPAPAPTFGGRGGPAPAPTFGGRGGPAHPPPGQAPPGQAPVAGTHDPNYQTLAGIEGDVFGGGGAGRAAFPAPGARPVAAPGPGARPVAAPAPGARPVAGTHDPNYQTLAGIAGDVFKEKKEQPKQGVAGTHDPNYQTLAGIGGDVFG